ncbi:hypothetical protein [Kribbella sp. NPDC051718]|uniref:hypothetical protein n=1 Tax=Kribbella sp. NPDC051718 TaxID=3155168 RepID=UPI0034225FA7
MASARRVSSVGCLPRAICIYVYPADHHVQSFRGKGCTWSKPSSDKTRDAAKAHTAETGHNTLVVAETIDEYEQAVS